MISMIKNALSAFHLRRYPEITCYKCGENRYRVVTRNGLGSERVFETSSEPEMKKIADESFKRLFG